MGYGEVAKAAGFPRYSRIVSKAISRSPEDLPWFRVVRSNRTLTFEFGSEPCREQVELLKLEGVEFDGIKIITVSPEEHLDKILWSQDAFN
ncbi:MAG: alkylated DNA nucleotide flippase Atl1 [Planctomycetota bacterium]|jgi:alkylated DNA nucleotide flippase Atl1